jgi:hypothetical protein
MNAKTKEFLVLFIVQAVAYSVICINTRAIADVNYGVAMASDLGIASLNFFVIRRIASSAETMHQFAGYVLGSLFGTAAGIKISTLLQ